MNLPELTKNIEKIIQDNRSGSTILSERIEKIFPHIPDDSLHETLARILSAHSSMAAVINRINLLCLRKEGQSTDRIKSFSEETFRQFWSEHQHHHRWITLSMSHWVIECLKYSKIRREIHIGISRPDKEGLVTRKLLREYHSVHVCEDTRLVAETEKSDGIILGADMIGKKHIINKSGSLALAMAAKHYEKPLFILSSGDKTLTEELLPFFKMKKVRHQYGWTHYFEKVPVELVTRVYLTTDEWQYPLSSILKEMTSPQPLGS